MIGVGAEHVVEGDRVRVAGLLGGARPPGDRAGLVDRVELREDHAERHRAPLPQPYAAADGPNASRKRASASVCSAAERQPAPIVLTERWLTPLSPHRRASSAACT